jgi:hypothetical protein
MALKREKGGGKGWLRDEGWRGGGWEGEETRGRG